MLSLNPHRLPGVLFIVAMAVVIANRARLVDAKEFLYIPYNGMDASKLGNHGPYQKNDPLRQHLHVYQAPSEKPTPVYIYSHADGGTATLSDPTLKTIQRTGYSTISWESQTVISTNTIENCWNDFELVWLWFKANAAKYNLDPDTVVIGGRSRGTLCSWPLAYSERPEIKGIYMYNALPDMAWDGNTKLGSSYVWNRAVTKNAPPTQFLYGPECPKPIKQNCKPSPKKKDAHNPRNGQTIVDVYKKRGIESRIQLTDGLTNNDIGAHDLFPKFVASISSSSTSKGSSSTSKGSSSAEKDSSSIKKDSPSTSSGGGGSSVTTATSSSPDAASATSRPRRKIFFIIFIISVCIAFAVFGYNKYYIERFKRRKNSYERNTDDDGVCMQDMDNSSYRDEFQDEELDTNDDGLSMQDTGNTSSRDERKQLDGILILD